MRLLFTLALFAASAIAQTPRTIHVFVALADNQYQGIVPVPKHLGNGDDPARNLYWGSAFGVRTFFSRAAEWKLLRCSAGAKPSVLERCIFEHRASSAMLIADAYQGREIRQSFVDFLHAASGAPGDPITLDKLSVPTAGAAQIVTYIGHDGFMDFQLSAAISGKADPKRRAIILACASKQFFASYLRPTGASPLLWTTGLMAPEAYTLKAALDGWLAGESDAQIHERAAVAYHKYQKCGLKGARRLFATGW